MIDPNVTTIEVHKSDVPKEYISIITCSSPIRYDFSEVSHVEQKDGSRIFSVHRVVASGPIKVWVDQDSYYDTISEDSFISKTIITQIKVDSLLHYNAICRSFRYKWKALEYRHGYPLLLSSQFDGMNKKEVLQELLELAKEAKIEEAHQ